ncbi:MAG: Uncharacterized protein CEN90_13 [Parcubacteria group bacterium Licking1014_17]|nr:MAG: Uncharacterized protein CEN90_13 [Parcubacteria group bacterium Licking1014_17]
MIDRGHSRSGVTLTGILCALVLIGLAILLSAGIVEGQKKFDSPYYYFIHQLIFGVLPGIILYIILSRFDYRRFRGLSLLLLIGALIFMVLIFVPGVGFAVKGSQRWLDFGILTFQPSEVLKLALILYFAAWFSRKDRHVTSWTYSVVPFLLVAGFSGALLVMQPDFGTLGVVAVIVFSMYFFAGAKISHLVGIVLCAVALVAVLSVFSPYRFNRIKAFLNPSGDTQGISYHINQSLIGIGSGGLFGVGFGQSKQKISYLPEPVGDSIFAVYAEEMGLLGAAALISLFIFLALTLLAIAKKCGDGFGRLIALGMMTWVVGQAFVNIAAISGLVPLTGLPLPFVSFGSSSLVSILAGMGIVRNVAKHI